MLERYGHGGDMTTARELFGLEPGRFADFSANMNPLGPPPSVAALLANYASQIGQYPDPAVRRLAAKLAGLHEIAGEAVLVGNGAAELIDLTVRLLRPKATVVAAPGFAEYEEAARKCGSPVRRMTLLAEERFKLTARHADAMLAQLRSEGCRPGEALWMLGSPGNPTGQPIDRDVIGSLLDNGERVALDEAFIDFMPDADRLSFIREASVHERLTVIRSMTKFYAIPGIRLGYMVAIPDVIARLKELQVPWSVNSLAQSIGEAVLGDRAYRDRTMEWLRVERPWLAERLASLGLVVYEGAANYLLFSIPQRFGMTAGMLQQALGRKGVLIRDASGFAGLDPSYCRVAVRGRTENARLLEELKHALENPLSD